MQQPGMPTDDSNVTTATVDEAGGCFVSVHVVIPSVHVWALGRITLDTPQIYGDNIYI